MAEPPMQAIEQCDCELNDLDEQILAYLGDPDTGARAPRTVQRDLDTNVGRSWLCRRLKQLVDDGPVEKIDHGLYRLVLDVETEGERYE